MDLLTYYCLCSAPGVLGRAPHQGSYHNWQISDIHLKGFDGSFDVVLKIEFQRRGKEWVRGRMKIEILRGLLIDSSLKQLTPPRSTLALPRKTPSKLIKLSKNHLLANTEICTFNETSSPQKY
jgi:hypothetical protein